MRRLSILLTPKKVHQKILKKHIIEICVLNKVSTHNVSSKKSFKVSGIFFKSISLNYCALESSAKDCL